MITKDIPNDTMMKLIAHILKGTELKKYKIKGKQGITVVTPEDIIDFASTMAKGFENGTYIEVHRCETCGNFAAPGKDQRGNCFPKNFTSSKHIKDYCSHWIPMTEDQKMVRKKLFEVRAKKGW